ncbi:15390_t:CDS:2, partial [Entrophospora sp. SA101]
RVEELERYKKENEKRFEKLEEKQLKNVNNFENIANVSDSVINHCIDTDTKSLDDDTSELIDERCDDTPASDIFDNTSNCDLRHESLTQCSAPSNCTESESLKDKEMNNIIDFLVERDNERIRKGEKITKGSNFILSGLIQEESIKYYMPIIKAKIPFHDESVEESNDVFFVPNYITYSKKFYIILEWDNREFT